MVTGSWYQGSLAARTSPQDIQLDDVVVVSGRWLVSRSEELTHYQKRFLLLADLVEVQGLTKDDVRRKTMGLGHIPIEISPDVMDCQGWPLSLTIASDNSQPRCHSLTERHSVHVSSAKLMSTPMVQTVSSKAIICTNA